MAFPSRGAVPCKSGVPFYSMRSGMARARGIGERLEATRCVFVLVCTQILNTYISIFFTLSLSLFVSVYIYTCVYLYCNVLFVCVCVYIHSLCILQCLFFVCACVYTCILSTYMYTAVYMYIHIFIAVRFVCIHVLSPGTYIQVCIHIYVYIHIHFYDQQRSGSIFGWAISSPRYSGQGRGRSKISGKPRVLTLTLSQRTTTQNPEISFFDGLKHHLFGALKVFSLWVMLKGVL